MDLPGDLYRYLPSSYDIIGDVALIKIPHELDEYRMDIANSLIRVNRNIRKVAADRGVKGDFRLRNLEPLVGGEDLETVHIENNVRIKLDPGLVYYSPRLATERMRIATMIGRERILDMFSGVGPFSLTIARHSEAERIFGIDLNPDCIRYFELNISLNGLEDRVEAILGDSIEVTPTIDGLDRIIMNLPHSSLDFLPIALEALNEGYIHLYSIVESGGIKEIISRIQRAGDGAGSRVEIRDVREVHTYSPTSHMMGFDLFIS